MERLWHVGTAAERAPLMPVRPLYHKRLLVNEKRPILTSGAAKARQARGPANGEKSGVFQIGAEIALHTGVQPRVQFIRQGLCHAEPDGLTGLWAGIFRNIAGD